jgi:hypothetical protein
MGGGQSSAPRPEHDFVNKVHSAPKQIQQTTVAQNNSTKAIQVPKPIAPRPPPHNSSVSLRTTS